ncbi:HlyD family secretion protein [Chitinophaga ginsengisegetis]|uniref:HlyD family secretion protein n=1 Tax=Chitinophaga ginsengisegetis TaxID=393003 RepID=A0A1T5P5X5_9BACT|nr:efflux RND transporter periplasmic adaptor subunit [Chitinophaga ginsengisegetis]MDR6566431.1 HlyD family secretion protein [Chitinophaga ginsengisegetis]MDR6646161.1 HlyD family secretion protein [Chitinophaga ginsengisegetis]MDR6651247.1 HlyD family secretion protein [Chitinophaga ginsengisegetis]SKD08037.1 HlyD family secretion protein [Chitinophaga ginsengisegetis]
MDRKLEKKFWNKKRILMIGGGAAVAMLLLYTLLFADHRATLNVEKDKITISTVKKGTFDVYIAVTAVVMPLKTIRLDAIEGGYVSRKYLDGGSMVKEGDSILRLDNQHMMMDFVNHETEIYRLRNELQNTRLSIRQQEFTMQQTISDIDAKIAAAQDLYDRNKQLVEEKIVARQEFNKNKFELEGLLRQKDIQLQSQKYQQDNAKMQITQLEGTLARTQRNLDLMRENLNSLIVRAPVSGQLSSIDVEVGSSITAGQNIGQIDDLNGFKLRADIDEHYVSQVFAGLKATFEFDGKSYEMLVTKVYPEVKSGRFQADMTFEKNTPEGIRRGQSSPIRLVLGKSAEAILLPLGGFFSDTGGNWVYVVDKSGNRAVKRNISLGRKNPLYFEVLEGLQPGDQVITSSYENFGNKDVLSF